MSGKAIRCGDILMILAGPLLYTVGQLDPSITLTNVHLTLTAAAVRVSGSCFSNPRGIEECCI